MSADFSVTFVDCPTLFCKLDDTDLAARYLALLRDQVQDEPTALFRDPQRYTLEYWQKLVDQVETELGWDWHRDSYELAVTTQLHKDLEQYLAQGYANIPQRHDNLLHELHFCLHAIESGSRRDSWLQIEWFNDRGFAISAEEYPARTHLQFGDLRLQNPYVGHHPLYVFQQRDGGRIEQTCRFHDWVKPGINIVIDKKHHKQFDPVQYQKWWRRNAPDFVDRHGMDTLMAWTGHPVVGRVQNISDLEWICARPYLALESLWVRS